MFDVSLLPAFIAVSETGSFTRAAERLGLTQSTVSQQIRKLEAGLRTGLFVRNTHKVTLTQAGTVMLGHARTIQGAVEEAVLQMRGPDIGGEIRFGIAEDFAASRLPDILRRFRRAHPRVEIRIEIEMSRLLLDRLERGDLDLALVKCRKRDRRPERPILSDRLVWVGTEDCRTLCRERPLPLALHPEPSITRTAVLERLDAASIPSRVVHTSFSLNGLRAGISAGIGLGAFCRTLVPPGLRVLDHQTEGLPGLPSLDFVLARSRRRLGDAAGALIALIEDQFAP